MNRKVREALLDSLRELLVKYPLQSISIEAIAGKAGIGKQTIYRWYRDKFDLFVDLYETDSINRLVIQDMGSVEKELNELALQTWLFWEETSSGHAFSQLLALSQISIKSVNRLRNEFLPKRRLFTEIILNRALTRGEITDCDTNLFVDLWMGFNIYHLLTNNLKDKTIIPSMVKIVLRGIMPK